METCCFSVSVESLIPFDVLHAAQSFLFPINERSGSRPRARRRFAAQHSTPEAVSHTHFWCVCGCTSGKTKISSAQLSGSVARSALAFFAIWFLTEVQSVVRPRYICNAEKDRSGAKKQMIFPHRENSQNQREKNWHVTALFDHTRTGFGYRGQK